jgi:ATP-dependent Clp protease ATP-binding subunit ClpA
VSRLIGAPPGYVGFDQGGLMTEAITKHPHCVLLLDEIEKAHPDVFNLLLQVMDHGTLTDNNGRKADFRHVIIVMTTNAGAQEMSRPSIGFMHSDNASDGMEAIRRLFTPEFRNRLDAVIQFAPLDRADHRARRRQAHRRSGDAARAEGRAAQRRGCRAQLDCGEGYDPKMGARPMARVIQEHIKRPLAEELLVRAPGRRRPGAGERVGGRLEARVRMHSGAAAGSHGLISGRDR